MIAKLGDGDDLERRHHLAHDPALEGDRARLGGAVHVVERDLEASFDEVTDLGRRRRGAGDRVDQPIPEERATHLRHDPRPDPLSPRLVPRIEATLRHALHQLGLVMLVDHPRRAGDEQQRRGPGEADILEEGRHVARAHERDHPSLPDRADDPGAPRHVVQGHVVDGHVGDGREAPERR